MMSNSYLMRSDSSSTSTIQKNKKFKHTSDVIKKSSGYFTEKRVTEEPPLDVTTSDENHVNPLDSPTF